MFKLKVSTEDNKVYEVMVDSFEEIFTYSDNLFEVPSFEEANAFNFININLQILIPLDDGSFVYQYEGFDFFNRYGLSPDKIIGRKASDIFPLSKQLGFVDIVHSVYNSNQEAIVDFQFFKDDSLEFASKVTFVKDNGKIYIFYDETTEIIKSNELNNSLFENNVNGLFIIQDEKYVDVNETFLNWISVDKKYIVGTPFKLEDFILEGQTIEEWKTLFYKILNKEVLYGSGVICYYSNNGVMWFDTHAEFMEYEGKPALLVSLIDITQKKIAENNALNLQKNLTSIQRITKTAVSHFYEGEYYWPDEFYNLIERKPKSEDRYKNVLSEYLLDDGYRLINRNYVESLSEDNDYAEFKLALKTDLGNLKYIQIYLKLVFDNQTNKKRYIWFSQDITESELSQKDLLLKSKEAFQLKNDLELVQGITKLAIGNWNSKDNSYTWTDEIYNILDFESSECSNKVDLLDKFIIPEDKTKFSLCNSSVDEENPIWSEVLRIKTLKGKLKYLNIYSIFTFEEDFVSCVSFVQDISSEKEYENHLKEDLYNKKMLLKEVHHRIKNNLQILSSLINLDKHYNADPANMIDEIQGRISAMALIHEKIYSSDSLSHVNIKNYIYSIVRSLFNIYSSNIHPIFDLEDIELDMDKAIPLGLIINELVNNTIKYAFPDGSSGNLSLSLKKENDSVVLIFKDDGVGLDDDIDIFDGFSLGFTVINSLISQINANLALVESEGFGIKIEINLEE